MCITLDPQKICETFSIFQDWTNSRHKMEEIVLKYYKKMSLCRVKGLQVYKLLMSWISWNCLVFELSPPPFEIPRGIPAMSSLEFSDWGWGKAHSSFLIYFSSCFFHPLMNSSISILFFDKTVSDFYAYHSSLRFHFKSACFLCFSFRFSKYLPAIFFPPIFLFPPLYRPAC